jgi:chromate transport protein ChrA
MAGLVGMGGPAVVLWVMAHDWTNRRSRTLMWCAFALLVPWQLTVAYHRFGSPVLTSALLGLAYSPLVIIATMVGTRLGNRLSQNRLRLAAYAVLIGVGVVNLLGPAFQ